MQNILIFSLISGSSTLLGVWFIKKNKDKAMAYAHIFNAFAAGIILGIAFLHMLPECMEIIGERVFLWAAIGFSIFYFLETFLVIHPGPELHSQEEHEHGLHASNKKNKGLLIFSGLFFHSLLDGVIIALGFEHSFQLGLVASLGVILHELPEGVSSYALLIQSVKEKLALSFSVWVALATPIGAILTTLFFPHIGQALIGFLLALAGGSFIYIATADILPETHCCDSRQTMSAYVIGFLLMAYLA